MRNCLLCLSFLATSLYPASLRIGGTIPAVNTVECWPAGPVDFTVPADDMPVLRCRIDNNAPSFQVDFDFGGLAALGHRGEGGSGLTGLTLHEVGGSRGEGLADPAGMDVLPLLRGNRFTWSPGPQITSTRGYVVEFRADWKGAGVGNGKATKPAAGPIWASMSASL